MTGRWRPRRAEQHREWLRLILAGDYEVGLLEQQRRTAREPKR